MAVVTTALESGASPLIHAYLSVRRLTESLCEGLATEDYVVQSMEDVSPTKWHLAHTSWFFETFVLASRTSRATGRSTRATPSSSTRTTCRRASGTAARSAATSPGPPSPRSTSTGGTWTRPCTELLGSGRPELTAALRPLVEIGLNHEQQHQELLVTDIKHVFSVNPLRPAYPRTRATASAPAPPLRWVAVRGRRPLDRSRRRRLRLRQRGAAAPRYLEPFELASRPVTCGEYLAFMEDGGYERADLWLSAGWATVQEMGWTEPFYWERGEGGWWLFTLSGMRAWTPTSRSATSATSRPTPSPAGPARGSPPRPSGRSRPRASRSRGTWPNPGASTRRPGPGRRRRGRSCRCTATSGSGRGASTRPTRATRRPRARSASTTGSSCATSSCCAAAPAPPRGRTSAPPTATSSRRTPPGSSPGMRPRGRISLAAPKKGRHLDGAALFHSPDFTRSATAPHPAERVEERLGPRGLGPARAARHLPRMVGGRLGCARRCAPAGARRARRCTRACGPPGRRSARRPASAGPRRRSPRGRSPASSSPAGAAG
jgi:hypothetical protein